MIVSPGFLVCIFIAAQYQYGNVRCFCYINRLSNQLTVFQRIAKVGSVGPPVTTFLRNLAPFCIRDLYPSADLFCNPLKYADTATRLVAISAKMCAVGVWPNDGNRLKAGSVQRQ